LTRVAPLRPIHVVAAVLIDTRRRVLIAQRPAGKHHAGAWEFPGGKLEPGEGPAEGLERELREEIGVEIGPSRPLMRLRHRYPYGEVLLDVWVVRRYRGRPRSLDGQALHWCDRAALVAADLLPADRPILAALKLPERLRLSTTQHYRVVRARDLADARRGLADAREGVKRPSRAALLGAACADAAEAKAAVTAGADFIVLGTVLEPRILAALCSRVSVPLFARGVGLERAWASGASGVNALM
jgi:mutator protein MutT